MKYKTVLSTLTLSAASIFISELYAQQLPPLTKSEYNHMDSLQAAYKRGPGADSKISGCRKNARRKD